MPAAVREGQLKRATAQDFRTEFGGLVMAVKVVENLGDAANHINEHSSHHTDCIVAADAAAVELGLGLGLGLAPPGSRLPWAGGGRGPVSTRTRWPRARAHPA